MGIAALILGILGLLIAWIPFCGVFALIPCLIGLGLGIADIVVKSRQGMPMVLGIFGTVLNGVALILVIVITILFGASAAEVMSDPEFKAEFRRAMEEAQKEANRNGVVVEAVEVEDIAPEAPEQ